MQHNFSRAFFKHTSALNDLTVSILNISVEASNMMYVIDNNERTKCHQTINMVNADDGTIGRGLEQSNTRWRPATIRSAITVANSSQIVFENNFNESKHLLIFLSMFLIVLCQR